MKVLTSQEAFAYKQQLETIREQMRQIEERGVYDIAGNIIKPSDRKEYKDLKEMENHVRQLAAGIQHPLPLQAKKRKPQEPPKELTDEEWKELAELAREAFKDFHRCADTKEEENEREDAVEAQRTHDGDRS